MAKLSATLFKAEVATAATALSTALKDDTLATVAQEFKNSKSPIRQLLKLFIFDWEGGVAIVKANDAYIDAAYAGKYPSVPTGNDKNAE